MGTKDAKKSLSRTSNIEFDSLKRLLKELLRKQKISYKELAKKLAMSESGVKKLLSGSDCSYSRLNQVAEVLGVGLLDLLEELQNSSLVDLEITQVQQEAFDKNATLFSLFYKLSVERSSVEEAEAQLKLGGRETFSLLRKLDELSLVRLMPQNKVKVFPLKMVRSFGKGAFLSKTYRHWGHSMVKDLADPEFQKSGQFLVRSLKMKEETYQEFLQRLIELDSEFTRRGIREMNLASSNLKLMRWMSFSDQKSFV